MLAVVQFRPIRGQPTANLARLAELTQEALAGGARLVVLPEMASSGYRFRDATELRPWAESPTEGPTFATLAPLAARHAAHIVVGFAESTTSDQQTAGRLFNSALVIGPTGDLICCYRKRLLYTDDTRWASPGDTPYPRFDTPFGPATVGICMDVNDTRFTEHIVRTRPAVVCFPTNWIDQGLDIHAYWAAQLWGWSGILLAADRWGEEDGVGFWGRSAILVAGRVAASAPASGDAVVLWRPGQSGPRASRERP